MSNTVRIKRRAAGGSAGAPASLANAELAFNEQDDTLYYGKGTGGAGGTASQVIAIAGPGTFAPLASPALTGAPTAPTAAADTNTTQVASTAFVVGQASSASPSMNGVATVGSSLKFARGDHIHPTDTSRAPVASPALTGTPTAPTAAADTSTTQLATTAFVTGQAASTTPNMDGTAAVGTSVKFARADHTHPTDSTRAPLASPALTGTPTAPTATNGTNTTQVATTAFVLATHPEQLAAPTDSLPMNNQRITGLADPTGAQDAATKNYVDSVAQGLDPKQSVRAASTANIASLSGTMTIDGIALVAGDRVLVKNQTTASQNGIYVVAAGSWTRSSDSDLWAEIVSAFVFVESGATNADNGFLCTVDPGGVLGSTAITFVQFSGAGQIAAGAGMTKTGNQLDVGGTANRIAVNADSVDIDANYAGQTSITTLGTVATGTWNATTIAPNKGGTGAAGTLTGYVKGNGASAMTASATIPNTDITGLGTMSTQAASAVAITGGSITNLATFDGITIDGGTF